MYLNTKKAWERLPEVRKKVEEEKKQSQAATNRLRVKLYQKVCQMEVSVLPLPKAGSVHTICVLMYIHLL